MQAKKSEILKMNDRLQRIIEKDHLSKEEIAIIDYALSFITLRIKILADGKFPDKEFGKIEKKESMLLKYLSEAEIKALNLSILYLDIDKNQIRKRAGLKKLKKEITDGKKIKAP